MTRFIVCGAGAIGGPLAAGLSEAGHNAVAVARGSHYEAIAAHGLRVEAPEGPTVSRLTVVDHPSRLEFRDDDIVMLAMKSHDIAAAPGTLAGLARPSTPIVCVQNGVENERAVLRLFPNIYGVLVYAGDPPVARRGRGALIAGPRCSGRRLALPRPRRHRA